MAGQRLRRVLALTTLAAAVFAAFSANALAAAPTTASISGSTIVVTASPGVANNITVSVGAGNTIYMNDTGAGAGIAEGDGCSDSFSYGVISCPTTGITMIQIDGGDLNDTITTVSGLLYFAGPTIPSTVIGGDGNDKLHGGNGSDTLDAGAGNDELYGNGGADTLIAGTGQDFLSAGAGDDTLRPGLGGDLLQGDVGIDTADYSDRLVPVTLTLDGVANDGEPGENDNIVTDNEAITGGAGNDTLTGGITGETLNGGPGNDILHGLDGNDTLNGGPGADQLFGENQDDTLNGGDDVDTFSGGPGNDALNGGAGNETFQSEPGNESLDGGDGNDVFLTGSAPDGAEFFAGGNGVDEVSYALRTQPVNATVSDSVPDGEAGEGDNVYYNIENLTGGSGNDNLVGGEHFDAGSFDSLVDNTLVGNGGNDVLNGGQGCYFLFSVFFGCESGSDTLLGGPGNDTLLGGLENDSLDGGSGDDLLDGGPACIPMNQLYTYCGPSANADADVMIGGDGVDLADYSYRMTGIDVSLDGLPNDGFGGEGDNVQTENVRGSASSDTLTGDGGPNELIGVTGCGWVYMPSASGFYSTICVGGNDTMQGLGGDDHLVGGDIGCYGQPPYSPRVCSGGDDTMLGGPGNDLLEGHEGNDNLVGGTGADILSGQGGDKDTADYSDHAGAVVVSIDDVANDGSPGENDNAKPDVEAILGGAGNDNLTGSSGDNIFKGNPGNDTFHGGAGVDTADYSAAGGVNITIDGLANDFDGQGSAAENVDTDVEKVIGTPNADNLTGGAGPNILLGGGGDDSLDGKGGADELKGEAGNDTLVGGPGADIFSGGDGTADLANYLGGSVGVTVTVGAGADDGEPGEGDTVNADVEVVQGTNQADNITGGAADNTLRGFGGNDSLAGAGGNDTLDGGLGQDTMAGGGGTADVVTYSLRSNPVTADLVGDQDDGEAGELDQIQSDVENLIGGLGSDDLGGNAQANRLEGGPGVGNDVLNGGGAVDTLLGGFGDDRLQGGAGADSMDGGQNTDTVDYADRTDPVTVTLDGVANDGASGENDNLIAMENVLGGSGADNLTGGPTANVLDGGPGPDQLHGLGGVDTADYSSRFDPVTVTVGEGANDGESGEGDDVFGDIEIVVGGHGADSLTGDGNSNQFDGGPGGDTMAGGGGTDIALYTSRTAAVQVSLDDLANDGAAGENDNVLSDMENITGGTGNDLLIGDGDANTLNGGFGASGDDDLRGEGGNDNVQGAAGNDHLDGGGGNDNVNGDDGDDVLVGGVGADTLFGGTGFDTISYETHASAVTVTLDGVANDGGPGENDNVGTTLEKLLGSSGNDHLTGSDGDDFLAGGPGSDQLSGLDGNDRLQGGPDSDALDGGSGQDLADYSERTEPLVIDLGGGLSGRAGPTPEETKGEDELSNMEGAFGGSGDDTITGSEVSDRLVGGPGDDVLTGALGDDQLEGGEGDDTFAMFPFPDGNDELTGGAGSDTVDYSARHGHVLVDLVNGTAGEGEDGKGAEEDNMKSFDVENAVGGLVDDELIGDDNDNQLTGGPGADTVTAGGGNDFVRTKDDKEIDTADCGQGDDDALADEEDLLTDCERVIEAVTVSIGDANGAEGTSDPGHASFTVTLHPATADEVKVDFATSDGTADSTDYKGTSGTLTFAPNETEETIEIPFIADGDVEPDETFFVTILNPVNAELGADVGTATIRNDDPDFTLTVGTTGTGIGKVQDDVGQIYCEDDCEGTYGAGTLVELSPILGGDSVFAGWSGDCSGTGACIVTMDGAKDVTATFDQPLQTLTVSRNGNGSGGVADNQGQVDCGLDCSGAYAGGTVVQLTPSPAASSTFAGWSGACVGSGACSVTMNSAKNVTATFTKNRYVLSAESAGTGAGTVTDDLGEVDCGSDCSGDYDADTVVHLSATPSATSTFTGWSDACTGTGSCTVTMTAAKDVTATFAKNRYTLAVDQGGTGFGSIDDDLGEIACDPDCSGEYDADTLVTLTATPADNSTFSGWTGACTADPCTVTMDAAKNVLASFEINRYGLGVSSDGTGTGSVADDLDQIDCGLDCSGEYDADTVVTLAPSPDANSTFTGWTGACTGTGACEVTMDGAQDVTATFTLKHFVLTVTRVGNGSGSVSDDLGQIACGADCSGDMDIGTVITLAAFPAANSFFVGWAGACTGTGACVVPMDATKAVSARFNKIPCVVPNLRNKTRTGAVNALVAAHCRLGDVTRAFSNRVKTGRVISQSPAPGATKPQGFRVDIKLSRGRR